MGHADPQRLPPRRQHRPPFLGLGAALRAARTRPAIPPQRPARPGVEHVRRHTRGSRRLRAEARVFMIFRTASLRLAHDHERDRSRALPALILCWERATPMARLFHERTGGSRSGREERNLTYRTPTGTTLIELRGLPSMMRSV